MKKSILVFGLAVIMVACNQSSEKSTTEESSSNSTTESSVETNDAVAQDTSVTQPATVSQEDLEKGKQLIANSDCLACHQEDTKVVGPAYVEVAKKYEATPENIQYLTGKIIEGGSGVWGDIPMAPHPGMDANEAKLMVQYILSLAK